MDKEKESAENTSKELKKETKELVKKEDITNDEKKLQKINEEIKANKKKSRNSVKKHERNIKILRNVIVAIVGIAYIEIMLLGSNKIPAQEFVTDLKVFILLSLLCGLIMFEKAYKLDKSKYMIHGLESIAMGSVTIILLDLLKKQSSNIKYFFIGVLIVWIIYFMIKCIVIGFKKEDEKSET